MAQGPEDDGVQEHADGGRQEDGHRERNPRGWIVHDVEPVWKAEHGEDEVTRTAELVVGERDVHADRRVREVDDPRRPVRENEPECEGADDGAAAEAQEQELDVGLDGRLVGLVGRSESGLSAVQPTPASRRISGTWIQSSFTCDSSVPSQTTRFS